MTSVHSNYIPTHRHNMVDLSPTNAKVETEMYTLRTPFYHFLKGFRTMYVAKLYTAVLVFGSLQLFFSNSFGVHYCQKMVIFVANVKGFY